ncbi:MAG: DEAD/DEAH box helicase [Thermoplasmata archaeon]|nr:DEAD/DEAH box helicase [Thermoplasmata archaeon]
MSVFNQLHPELQKAIRAAGITEPSIVQEKGIPEVLSGKNVLMIAPTGTGKTEAGLLPVLHKILTEKNGPVACIYITPLRALNRDMLRRTQFLCETLGLKVAVRHGDTTKYERSKQADSPAHLLITTPETFQILFLGKKLRNALKNVRYIIVDEIHELCGSERGYQLSVALERLEKLFGSGAQRIGLSATVGKPEEVAQFLAGVNRDCRVVDCGMEKSLRIEVCTPAVSDEDIKKHTDSLTPENVAAMREIAETIEAHRGVLLFVNTRAAAEFLGVHMQHLFPNLKLAVHHGSLAKEVRVETEELFKKGDLKAIIATSSLELGIDIGHVDMVIQYNSPRQAGRLLQRVGRSGHGLGKTSEGKIICEEALDALEAGVLAKMGMSGRIEGIRIRENPLSVLANQVMAHATAEKSFMIAEFYETVKNAHPFRTLTFDQYMGVVKELEKSRRIFVKENRIEGSKRARAYFNNNISMIPDERTYKVVDLTSRKIIAVLDESFVVQNLEPGKEFAVKGSVWLVEEIHEDSVFVVPSQHIAMPPSWTGEEIPVPFECAMEVGRILRTKNIDCQMDGNARRAVEKLFEMDCLPSDNEVHVCLEKRNCVIAAAFGSRVNETLARAISILLSAKLGESVGFSSEPYCIVLELPRSVEIEDVRQVISNLAENARGLRSVIEKGVGAITYFRWIFVNVAKKFGLIERDADYSQINMERFIEAHRDSEVFREAVEKTIFEHMDIETAMAVLEKIADGEIKVNYHERMSGFCGKEISEVQGFAQTEISVHMLNSVRERLMDTDMVLICMSCGTTVSYKLKNITRFSCLRCNSVMLAGMRKVEKGIIDACKKYFGARKDVRVLNKGEKRNLERAWLCANLVRDNGKNALIALAGRGIGPDTAARILSRMYENEDELIKEVIKAEIKYTQTKKYWK